MSLPLFLIVMGALSVAIYKCMKNEDALIELEDKIIEDIRDFAKKSKKKGNLRVIQSNATKNYSASKVRNDTAA